VFAVLRKFQVGCPCCDKLCDWAAFDSTLGVADQFTGDTGDWTINTGDKTINTSAAAAGLLHVTTYPYNADSTRNAGARGTVDPFNQHSVVCRFKATAAGTVAYLIVCAADADNYVALEITWGTVVGTFRLVTVAGGVVTGAGTTHTIAGLGAGNTVWAAVDFDAGEVRACVSSGKDAWANSGCDEILSPGLWVRHTRADSDSVAYAGESVGFAVASNTGTVTVYGFEAGCHGVKELCTVESEGFLPDVVTWSADGWTITGTTPTRIDWGTAKALQATAAAVMVHKNPLPAPYGDGALVTGTFGVSSLRLSHGAFSYGLLVNCDAAGANGHKVTATVTPTSEDGTTVYCNYAVQLAAIGAGGGTINAAYSGTITVPRGAEYTLPTLRVYRVGDRLKLDGVAAAHEATGISDCGDFHGAFLTPGNNVSLTSYQVFLVGEINEHWPSEYTVCGGPAGACLYCDDADFPLTVLAEVVGLEDDVCGCDWLNRAWYATGGGCTKTSPTLGRTPVCQPHTDDGITWDVEEAYLVVSLISPLPGNAFGLTAGKIHLFATLSVVLRNTGGTVYQRADWNYALDLGADAGTETVDCAFENAELSYVGIGGAASFGVTFTPPCAVPSASKMYVTSL
jgi:hypothetical protein